MSLEVPAILEGRGLVRNYRLGATVVPALRGVRLEIRRGEFLVLQGPSGSGKTTLMNLLGLLDRPDEGEMLLDGRGIEGLDENALADLRRDRIGFVFQTFNLVPVLTIAENVEYPLMLKGVPPIERRRRAHSLLARVGLAGREASRPDLLSGGERQRVAIARAVVNEPDVVLADEPTASLDTRTSDEILRLVDELNEERGVAFVVATHDPKVVAKARRVLTLQDGRFVETE